MIEVVEHAFYVEEKKEILNDVFLTLQKTMIGVLDSNGENTFKLQRLGKDKLKRDKNLPVSIYCDKKYRTKAK